jgi:hypothetical protein
MPMRSAIFGEQDARQAFPTRSPWMVHVSAVAVAPFLLGPAPRGILNTVAS